MTLAGCPTTRLSPQAYIDCAAADYIRLYSLFVFLHIRCHGFPTTLLLIFVGDYCRTQKRTFSTRGGNPTKVSKLQKQHARSKVGSVCVMYCRLLSRLILLCLGLFCSLLFRDVSVVVHFLFYFEGASSCVLSGCCPFPFLFSSSMTSLVSPGPCSPGLPPVFKSGPVCLSVSTFLFGERCFNTFVF